MIVIEKKIIGDLQTEGSYGGLINKLTTEPNFTPSPDTEAEVSHIHVEAG